ncbi:glycosyltransferase family 2 protein [Flavisolibacter sp. BT320]|nr:glycosyltransferase family 2 protein [Flavisolibacter longurius]
MQKLPVISVIVPTYNHGCFLEEAINSVAAQTFSDWECLIIDDGSTDNTEEIAMRLCRTDNRVHYIKKENGGLSSARNRGLDLAKGLFIQFLDADDRLDAEKFSVSLPYKNEAEIIMTNFYAFTDSEKMLPPPFQLNSGNFSFRSILTQWDEGFVFPPHCGIYKSSLFRDLRFNETLQAREDWHMWLQLYLKNVKTVFIDRPLAHYRLSPGSMSQKKEIMDMSLVRAYQLICPFVPEMHKDLFFQTALNRLGSILKETHRQLHTTRQSKSYRLGNFFVRNFRKFQTVLTRKLQ